MSAGNRFGTVVVEGRFKGGVQVFGTTKVRRDADCPGCLVVRLWVKGKMHAVADDNVRVAP